MCAALRTFLYFKGRWDEQVSLSQQAEEKALAAADPYSAGWRALNAGSIYQFRGQAEEVLACAERSAAHWEKAPQAGANDRASATHMRGMGHELGKNHPEAIEAFQEALSLWRGIALESADVSRALNSLAGVECEQGDYYYAERDFREALRIAKKVDEREATAHLYG